MKPVHRVQHAASSFSLVRGRARLKEQWREIEEQMPPVVLRSLMPLFEVRWREEGS